MKRSKAYRAAAENIDATQLYSAEEALAYGLVARIVTSMRELG